MKLFKSIYTKLSLAGIAILSTLASCEQEKFDDLAGTLSPYIMLEDVRIMHKGNDLILNSENLNGAQKITGVVISDHREGNLPEGIVIIQQHRKGRVRGMALKMSASEMNYAVGDSILVDIRNKELKKDGYLYINNVSDADIEIVEKNKIIRNRITTPLDIKNKPNEFESTLVQVLGGEMLPKPTAETIFLGEKILQAGADTLLIVTLETATFKNEILPRNINIRGIVLGTKNTNTPNSIHALTFNDIVDVSDPEVPEHIGETPIIITGFCHDPSGTDGNNEYIQLKANTDIDFSEVPFSVVTSNNAGKILHTAGWATGGNRTFKFNLTEGKVKKGEYFYVGGTSKRINGGGSTSISQVNWIRTLSTASNAPGDGFGSSNANLLANSGNASGIAIFIGVNVTEKSVPTDVIFYGGQDTASIISEDKKLGYRIANTDHYKIYDSESGASSPFFSMGNGVNDFRFEHHGVSTIPAGDGYFYKLGGEFNTTSRKWTKPRERTLIVLKANSTLNEIEDGEGVTIQID